VSTRRPLTLITETVRGRARTALRGTAAEESGFTLIELLIVMVILAILLSVAVPSFLGFKLRAEKAASYSSVRQGVPAAEGFYADRGGYTGMTAPILKASYDAGIKIVGNGALTVSAAASSSYTLTSTVGQCTATFSGPGATIVNTC
jgi:prepilin-type N-terminal cleavage/methylation domain-containing protein